MGIMKKVLTEVQRKHAAAFVAAVNVLHLNGTVPDGSTVTIGARVYECDDRAAAYAAVTPGRVRVGVLTGYASGTLNFDSGVNVADGNTVTVGTKIYTFRTALTGADGEVRIGGTIHRSIYNLVAALNVGNGLAADPPLHYGAENDAGEGAGVAYAAGMTANPATVSAGYGNDYDLWLTHLPGGTDGGHVAVAATLAGTGGWAETEGVLSGPDAPTAEQFAEALVNAVNSDPAGAVWAALGVGIEVVVWARRSNGLGLPCALSFGDGENYWEAATLHGGQTVGSGLRSVAGVRRTVLAAEATARALYVALQFAPADVVLQVTEAAGAWLAPVGWKATVLGTVVQVTGSEGVPLTAGQQVTVLAYQ